MRGGRWIALAASPALTACLSTHSGLSARPLGTGAAEVGLHGGVLLGEGQVLPVGNVEIRAGVSPSTDLLVETGMSGLGIGFKSTVTGPDSPLALAVAPQASGLPLILVNAIHLQLPVLIGAHYRAHELTVGPRVDWWHYDALGASVAAIEGTTVGGTVDLSLRLGPVRLAPELAVTHVLAGTSTMFGEPSDEAPDRTTVLQTNLFLLFERRSPAR